MRMRFAALTLVLGLAACAVLPPPAPVAPAANTVTLIPAAALQPAPLRPDLDRKWLLPDGQPRYPDNAGFSGVPVLVALPPGLLIDRFGEPGGRFFSPKGASFKARALPTICASLRYTAYRVTGPLLAWAGRAVPWFDEPGGATQFQTDASAALLVMDGIIEPLPPRDPTPCK